MAFRKLVKQLSSPLKLDDFFRQAYVDMGLIGERIIFTAKGRPATSSTILLAGSGRSGTTWVGDIIASSPGVQQIFEPLIPLWNSKVRAMTGWDRTDPYFRQVYLRPDREDAQWHAHLKEVLEGNYRNYWTDYQRNSLFPDRYLIKEIRMNLMLGYIIDHFQCQVVYLIRHPCAVIHSRLSLPIPWHADVKDILSQEDLVEDFLLEWVREIEKEKDLLGSHAVWWAVENLVALRELSTRPHVRIYYEDAALNPEVVAEEVSRSLGLTYAKDRFDKAASKFSRMTRPESMRASQKELLGGWQKKLSLEDQKRIIAWAHKLGILEYTMNILPVRMLEEQAG